MSDPNKKRYFGPTNFALKNRLSFLVLSVICIVFGLVSYALLPKEDNPEIKIPYIFVSTVYPGVSSEDMETLVTKPLEKYIKGIGDIKRETSASSESFSSIFIEFNPDINVSDALQKVRDKVSQAKSELPADSEEPKVQEFNMENQPVMIISLSGEYDPAQLKKMAKKLQDNIDATKGVLETKLLGGKEREIQIKVDLFKMNAFGLTFDDVNLAIAGDNVDIPGGKMGVGDAKYLLRVPGEFKSIEEIRNTVVKTVSGTPIYVRDVADVDDSFKEDTSFSRYARQNSVSIIVRRRAGENLIDLSKNIHQVLDEQKKSMPEAVKISIIGDRSEVIRDMVDDLTNNILTAIILVAVVLMFFMGGLNSLFVGVAIPLSMLISFAVLHLSGITLNMVVLFSLILALGMLVDDGIVIVENIYRHMEEGKPALEAAKIGTGEVAWPVITSTLTKIAAFLPLVFWPGIMGNFMKYLPITLIISLSASLFVAMFISPVLCSMYMTVNHKKSKASKTPSKVIAVYEQVLRTVISPEQRRPRLRVRAMANLLVFGALVLYVVLGKVGKTGLDYAINLNLKDNLIRILDLFGPSLFLGTIGVGILVFVYLSSFKKTSDSVLIRRIGIVSISVLVITSIPFLDMVSGYVRIVAGLLFLMPFFYWIKGLDQFDHSYIKRSLIVHSFVIMFFAAILSLGGVKVEFFPDITPEQTVISVEMPIGTSIQKTNEVVERVEAVVQKEVDRKPTNIRHFVTNVGTAASNPFAVSNDNTNTAEISIEFYKKPDRQRLARKFHVSAAYMDPFQTIDRLREAVKTIPGGKITVKQQEQGPPTGKAVSIEISGDNFAQLTDIAKNVRGVVERTEGVVNVADSLSKGNPEFNVSVDRDKAAVQGVSTLQVASTLRSAVNGSIVSEYRDDEDEVDIVVKLQDAQRNDLNFLQYLTIPGRDGVKVPLSQVATISPGNGVGSISRIDFKRVVSIEGDVSKASGLTPNDILPGLKSRLAKEVPLPAGYTLDFKGQQQEQDDSAKFLGQAFMVALFLIGIILVSEFNSLILPAIILFSVFLSFIGVVLGIYFAPILFNFRLSPDPFVIIMTGVGIISLAGVVVNNSIVLIDYIQQQREDGVEKSEAIIRAGIVRFRPVLLTASTAILGLIPMSLGVSLDFNHRYFGVIPRIITGLSSSEWWAPLCNAVIFGLSVATLLTLLMVPIFYYILDEAPMKFGQKIKSKIKARKRG